MRRVKVLRIARLDLAMHRPRKVVLRRLFSGVVCGVVGEGDGCIGGREGLTGLGPATARVAQAGGGGATAARAPPGHAPA